MSDVSWKNRYERLYKKQEREEERGAEMVGAGLDMVATIAGVAIPAYMHGRKAGMPAVAKLPIDALGAGLFTTIGWGLMAFGMPWGRHVAAFGTGFSTWWLGGIFAKWGQDARKKAGELTTGDATRDATQLTPSQADAANVQVRPPIVAGRGEQAVPRTRVPQPEARPYWDRYARQAA